MPTGVAKKPAATAAAKPVVKNGAKPTTGKVADAATAAPAAAAAKGAAPAPAKPKVATTTVTVPAAAPAKAKAAAAVAPAAKGKTAANVAAAAAVRPPPAAAPKAGKIAAKKAKRNQRVATKQSHGRKQIESRSGGVFVQPSRISTAIRKSINGQLNDHIAPRKKFIAEFDAYKEIDDTGRVKEKVERVTDDGPVVEIVERDAKDKEKKAARDYINKEDNINNYNAFKLQLAACQHERIRFSVHVSRYMAATVAYTTNKLIKYAASQVTSPAGGMVSVRNLCSGNLAQLSIYPLIAPLPTFKRICKQQQDEAFSKAVRDAATDAAKTERRKFARSGLKENSEKPEDTAKTIADRFTKLMSDDATHAENGDAAAENGDAVEGAEPDKNQLTPSINAQCGFCMQETYGSKHNFRIAMALKRVLADIASELIDMLATDMANVLLLNKAKTADKMTFRTVLANRMWSGKDIERVYNYVADEETDPEARLAEIEARKVAKAAEKAAYDAAVAAGATQEELDALPKRKNITDAELRKIPCLVAKCEYVLPAELQEMLDFIKSRAKIMKNEAMDKKAAKKAAKDAGVAKDAGADAKAEDEDDEDEDAGEDVGDDAGEDVGDDAGEDVGDDTGDVDE